MNAEEKVSNESDTPKGNKKRRRSQRPGKRERQQRQRTSSGISNDDNDATPSNEIVKEDEANEIKQTNEMPTRKRGRGRKRKTTNEEKSENSGEDNLMSPKQRKEDKDDNVQSKMSTETDMESSTQSKDEEMATDQEKSLSDTKNKDETLENKNTTETNSQATCHCSVMDRQQREIVNLKRKLQEKDVYGSATKEVQENRKMSNNSDEKLAALDSKLSEITAFMEDQKKNSLSIKIESLHNKVDKMIRLLSDVTETQKKNSKALQQLQKANEAQAQKEQEDIEKLKKTRYSASLPTNLAAVASKEHGCKSPKPEDVKLKSAIFSENNSRDESVDKIGVSSSPVKPPLPPDPLEEYRWGENMILIGDTFWRSFQRLEDVKDKVDKMEQSVQFRITAARDNEVMDRLYSRSRGKILFALPPKVKIVGISIGTTDILDAKPEHIKTLKEGPLNEVKKHNYDTLKFMAEQVKAMVDKLLSMNKFVLLLIPLYVKKREVFDQWQTVLTDIMADLPFPSFRILNLQNLMKSTLPQFASTEQMFETWLSNKETLELSAYGTRRLFDALKKAMWCSNKKLLENGAYLKNSTPCHIQQRCPRCVRFHAGGADTCKSRNMICKLCGKLGHFTDVHDVKDLELRKRIMGVLGEEINFFHSNTENAGGGNNGFHDGANLHPPGYNPVTNNVNEQQGNKQKPVRMAGPLTEKEMLERNSAQALLPWNPSSKLDDWYN